MIYSQALITHDSAGWASFSPFVYNVAPTHRAAYLCWLTQHKASTSFNVETQSNRGINGAGWSYLHSNGHFQSVHTANVGQQRRVMGGSLCFTDKNICPLLTYSTE